jgi:hypothetical protein
MENQPTASTGLKYAGWSIDDEFSFQNEGTTSLDHPAGAVMKFSSDTMNQLKTKMVSRFAI